MKNDLELKIKSLFFDSSNRPKKTPIHESSIQIRCEEVSPAWKVSYILQKLEEERILTSIVFPMMDTRSVKFFIPWKLNHMDKQKVRINEKIMRLSKWIKLYSDPKVTRMLGTHLHSLVKAELRSQGFIINSENSSEYNGVIWDKTKHSLDIIAKHEKKDIVIGVEVKNTLDLMDKNEIFQKIEMCKHLGLIPIFACRWLQPYSEEISSHGGFLWQFKKQIYPLGQEKFVSQIRQKFGFPMHVATELPVDSIRDFEKWICLS